MKLNFKAFENVAKSHGYENGQALLNKLGYPNLLLNLAISNNLGCEVVKDLFNELGRYELDTIVDFEGGSVYEFTNKYIAIGSNII